MTKFLSLLFSDHTEMENIYLKNFCKVAQLTEACQNIKLLEKSMETNKIRIIIIHQLTIFFKLKKKKKKNTLTLLNFIFVGVVILTSSTPPCPNSPFIAEPQLYILSHSV